MGLQAQAPATTQLIILGRRWKLRKSWWVPRTRGKWNGTPGNEQGLLQRLWCGRTPSGAMQLFLSTSERARGRCTAQEPWWISGSQKCQHRIVPPRITGKLLGNDFGKDPDANLQPAQNAVERGPGLQAIPVPGSPKSKGGVPRPLTARTAGSGAGQPRWSSQNR